MSEQPPQDPHQPGYTQPMAPQWQQPPPPPAYYGGPPVPYGSYPPMQVAPKSPGLSLLASFFIPGLGSMINGDVGKGIGILVGYLVSCVLVLILVGIFGMLAFWVWGMVDGYQGARTWNLRHGIIS